MEEVTVVSTSGVNGLPIQTRVAGATREREQGSGFERTTCHGSAKERKADEISTNPVSSQPNSFESMRRALPKSMRWISYSVSTPAGFPSTKWENLLKGKAVNLDVVDSSLFHVVAVRENRGRIGDHEISLAHTEPSRKVLTRGDWTTAWNLVIKRRASYSPVVETNLTPMENTSKASSPPAKRMRTGRHSLRPVH